ncbi:DNA polymerase III subunit gamma/tau [bacterium]|nr:DNA polymerase III subunit gamma/tau [bacterium]
MNKSYIPLYRKYRPQKLEEVVGQEHIKKALSNAIEMKRIAHAYLFTGPRGTGKTSTARIFAKSLNCINGPTISPCNECDNCKNITKSIPIDVIEIDAASNRSVNDAEEIIQNVAMAPVHSRYKIYIIDEVHMLTSTAFNALLKTLEEPPENVIFILATTEVHKVLDTIKSRCQRFDFKRITTDEISKHLRFISDKECINISDSALYYIAQNSAGGMRDSIALLDQLSILNTSEKEINVEDINRLLGRLSFEILCSLFEAISSSNQNNALDVLNSIYNQGNEPSQILLNLLEFLRNALVIKSINAYTDSVQLNEEQIKIIADKVKNLETHQIIALIDKCSNYIKELKLTSNPKLWLDVAILDMANLTENTKLADLNRRISILEGGAAVQMCQVAYNNAPAPVKKQEIVDNELHNSIEKNENVIKKPVSPEIPLQNADIKGLWVKFLDNISSFPSRAILKQQAIPVKLTADEVIIAIKNPTWLKNFSSEGERFVFLQESAKSVFGTEPKIIVRAPMPEDDKIRTQQSQESPRQDVKKPLIVEDNFSNKEIIEKVKSDTDLSVSAKKINHVDSAYHSDNVNMVMDLFEGKLIE